MEAGQDAWGAEERWKQARLQAPDSWMPGARRQETLGRCRPGSQDLTLPASSTHGCSGLWVGEPAAGHPISSKHVEGLGLGLQA